MAGCADRLAATVPVICCLITVAITAACGGSPSSGAAAAARSEAREVQLTTVTQSRLDRTIVVSGALAADEQAVLSFKVPGRLVGLTVDLGSVVSAGQQVAHLDPIDYRLRVTQAEAALRQARARLGLNPEGDDDTVDPERVALVRQAKAVLDEATLSLGRTRTFVERQIAPRSQLDTAEAAFKVAESAHQNALEEVRVRQALLAQRRSELESAREQLSATMLTAPFPGRILNRPTATGQYLAAGTPVVTLVRVNPLRLRVEIPEREAASIRLRQPVRVTVEGDPTAQAGTVARISPAIASDNRTLLVEAEIPNDPPRLRPGSFARAEIVVEAAVPALLIPSAAVVSFAGVDRVFTVDKDKAVERRVQLGRREGELVQVLKGLAAGESIVAKPGTLVPGQTVRIATR
jgi:RND family efflux transporter MFP subunit